jgi:hypothetical protein
MATERAHAVTGTRGAPAHAPTHRQPLLKPAQHRVLELQRDAGNTAVATGLGVAGDVVMGIAGLTQQLSGVIPFDVWFHMQSAILDLMTNLDLASSAFETAAIKADTEQLKREVAETQAATDRLVDHNQGHPGPRGLEKLVVLAYLVHGTTNDKELTDEVFFSRHPERRENLLDPKKPEDATLVSEWVQIRSTIVKPTLASRLGQSLRPGAGKKGAAGKQAKPVA